MGGAERTIHIGSVVQGPFIRPCTHHFPHSGCQRPGVETEILYKTALALNIIPIFHVFPSYEEAQTYIRNGSIDMAGYTDLSINWQYLNTPRKSVRVSGAGVQSSKPVFITRAVDSQMGENLIFAVGGFDIGLSLALLYLPLFMTRVFLSRNPDFQTKLVIGGTPICEIFWLVGFTICTGLYSNFLAIFLYHKPTVPQLFSNMLEYSQLISSGRCRLVLPEYFADPERNEFYHLLIDPDVNESDRFPDHHLYEINSNLRKANENFPPMTKKTEADVAEFIESTKDGRCYIGMAYNKYTIERQHCKLEFISLNDLGSLMYRFAYSLNISQTLVKQIDNFLLQGSINDFYEELLKKYAALTPRVNCGKKVHVPLNFYQLKDVFTFLGLSALVCSLLLLLERGKWNFKERIGSASSSR